MKRFYKFLTPVLLLIALAVPLGSRAQFFNFEDGVIPEGWTNDATHPWEITSTSMGSGHHGVYCIKSSNAGISNSTSTISVTVVFPEMGGVVSFYGGCWGEGTSSIWDKCIFSIDGNQQFSNGALASWDTYSYEVTSGSHTFTWTYSKDDSVNPTGDAFFVDDVLFSLYDEDFCPVVSDLTLLDLSATSAILGWNVDSVFTNVSNFTIEYGEQGFELGSGATVTTDGDSVILTGLTSGTRYNAYVYTNCTSGISDANMITFFTPSEPIVDLPYSTGFEEGNDISWTTKNGPNGWYIDTAAKNGGDYGLYISADTGRTNTYVNTVASASYAARNFTLDSGMYALGFDWRGVGEGTSTIYDYLQVFLAPGTTDFTASVSTNGWTELSPKLNQSAIWQTAGLQFPVTAQGNYYLVFYWYNDSNTGDNPPAAIDNVTLRQLSCNMPTNLAVTNTGITNATLSWSPAGNESEWAISVNGSEWHSVTDTVVTIDTLTDDTPYAFSVVALCGPGDTSLAASATTRTQQYCYKVTGVTVGSIGFTSAGISWTPSVNGDPVTEVYVSLVTDDSTAVVPEGQVVTGNSVLFTGLQPSTTYTARLVTVCDEHRAPDTATVTFQTSACGEITGDNTNSYVPFYGFYKYGVSQTLYDAGLVAAIDTVTGISYEVSTSNSLARLVDVYMGYTDITALASGSFVPFNTLTQVASDYTMDLSNGGWINIPFTTPFVPNGSGKLVVAVVNKTGAYSSFSWKGKNDETGSSMYLYTDGGAYDVNNLTGGTVTSFIPNTRFIGNCDLERCMASNVAVTGVTSTSIDLTWVANGTESSWVVAYRPVGSGAWDVSSAFETTTHTISGLTPGMGYDIKVGSICDEDTLWAAIVGYTECELGTLPYTNTFTADLGPCWDTTSVSRNAANYLSFNSTSSRAILPELPLAGATVMMGIRGSAANKVLLLGVTSDNGANVEWVDSVVATSATDFNNVTSTLGNYTGTATRLVLAPTSASVYVDYITVLQEAGCIPVEGLTVDTVLGRSATISWTSEATSFQFSYRATSSTTWIDTVVTGSPVDLTGLTPITSYQVRVRPDCGEDTTFWMSTSFTTTCAVEYTPFAADFSTDINVCWNRYSGLYDSVSPDLTPATYGWTRSTSNVFTDGHYKVNVYGESCNYWLVTPFIELGEDLFLNFDAALTDYNYADEPEEVGSDDRMVLAITTDSGAHWYPVAMWASTADADYSFEGISATGSHYVIDLSDYNNQVVRLGFYAESTVTNGDNDLHIDNIVIAGGGCRIPESVTASNLTLNSVDISWTDSSADMSGYEVRYGTASSPDATTHTTLTTNTTSVSLTGLTPNTRYYVWVRTNCGNENSLWTSRYSFRTPRSCYAPSNISIDGVGFTTASFSWSYNEDSIAMALPITSTIVTIKNLTDTSVADIVDTVTTTSKALSGLMVGANYRVYLTTICSPDTANAVSFTLSTNSCAEENTGGININYVPFYGYYGYGYSQTIYPASIVEHMDTIRGISYKVNSVPSSYTTRPVSVYLGTTSFTSLDTNHYVPVDSMQLMVTDFPMNVGSTGWTTIVFDTFFVYDHSGDIVVAVDNNTNGYASFTWSGHMVDSNMAVYWYRDGSDIAPANPGAGSPSRGKTNMVPDIRFEGECNLGSCLPPMLLIDSFTTTTAYITLVPGNEDNNWVVEYRLGGSDTWISTPASGLTTRTITGLVSSSLYEFRAGSLCDGDTIWTSIIEHYSECAAVPVPFHEDFSYGISPCWKRNVNNVYINASGDIYVYLSGTSNYLKTPVIDASVDTVQVRLNMYGSSPFRVGVCDEDGENVQWLDTLVPQSASAFHEDVLFVHNYSGTPLTGRRIVIGMASGSGYVTDVTVEPLMPCLPLRNLHMVDSAVSANSLVIDWRDLLSAGTWTVEYGPENFTRGTGTVMNVTSHPVTINGLTSSTAYHFYVTPGCSVDSTSVAGPLRGVTAFEPCAGAVIADNYTTEQTASTSSYSPIGYSYWNYSYVQTIVDSAVMANFTGDIVSFAFNASSITAGSQEFDGMTVYMANVSESNLSNSFIHPDSNHVFVEVLSNTSLNFTETGWNYVNFTTPFSWDGHSNVLFAVLRNDGDWASGPSFVAHNQVTNKMRYAYNDDDPYNINTVTGGYASNIVGDIRFISCGDVPVCDIPTILAVASTETNATVTFLGEAYNYELAIVEGPWTDSAVAAAVIVPIVGSPSDTVDNTFFDLTASTTYTIGVRALCSNGATSDWATQSVTTDEHPCLVPTNLLATDVTLTTATLTWNVGEFESQWMVNLTSTVNSVDTTFVVDTNNVNLTGLTPNAPYVAKVKAICSETHLSDWSTPATFTTDYCRAITSAPTTSEITSHSVKVSWSASSNSNGNYQIEYGTHGYVQGNGTRDDVIGATSYTIEGLYDETRYDVYVRSVCAEGIYSDWSPVADFTTLTASPDECNAPYNVSVGNITNNGATVSWDGSANQYEVEYGPSGFNHGEGSVLVASTTTQNLSDLTAATSYDVYVRSLCDNGNVSNWSAVKSFTTTQQQGIDDVNGSAVALYPNPASISVTLSGIEGQVTVTIVDLNGREVKKVVTDSENTTINLDGMAQGAYFVRIVGEQTNAIRKLIVR